MERYCLVWMSSVKCLCCKNTRREERKMAYCKSVYKYTVSAISNKPNSLMMFCFFNKSRNETKLTNDVAYLNSISIISLLLLFLIFLLTFLQNIWNSETSSEQNSRTGLKSQSNSTVITTCMF